MGWVDGHQCWPPLCPISPTPHGRSWARGGWDRQTARTLPVPGVPSRHTPPSLSPLTWVPSPSPPSPQVRLLPQPQWQLAPRGASAAPPSPVTPRQPAQATLPAAAPMEWVATIEDVVAQVRAPTGPMGSPCPPRAPWDPTDTRGHPEPHRRQWSQSPTGPHGHPQTQNLVGPRGHPPRPRVPTRDPTLGSPLRWGALGCSGVPSPSSNPYSHVLWDFWGGHSGQ